LANSLFLSVSKTAADYRLPYLGVRAGDFVLDFGVCNFLKRALSLFPALFKLPDFDKNFLVIRKRACLVF